MNNSPSAKETLPQVTDADTETPANASIGANSGSIKVKGTLPSNWGKLGLTDAQVQEVYKIRNKHNDEIDRLKAKIKELETARDKESKAVLTTDQKKRLDDILTGKDK